MFNSEHNRMINQWGAFVERRTPQAADHDLKKTIDFLRAWVEVLEGAREGDHERCDEALLQAFQIANQETSNYSTLPEHKGPKPLGPKDVGLS